MRVAFVDVRNTYATGFGAGIVASAIKQAGFDIDLYNTYWSHSSTIAKRIAKRDYDVLMISSMTILFPKAVQLIRMVKALKPDIPVLVGGIHAIMVGAKILEDNPEIDFLCHAEGETTAVEFLKNLGKESLYDLDNIAYRKDGKIIVNKLRPAENLDEIPSYNWDLFSKYEILLKNGTINIYATRGCPYNCTYCGNSVYLKKYGKAYLRFRSIDNVIKELQLLKRKYKPKFFHFNDEMMLFHKEYAITLLKELKSKVDVPYGFMARVEHINQEVVEVLKSTGCQYVMLGVECGNEEFRRKFLNRFMTNEQIENAFALVKKAGIFMTSFNMIGYPVDYDDKLTEDTVNLNKKLQADFTQISIFFPLPGTKLREYCEEHDLIDKEKLAKATDYYEDSVLKGVSLYEKRDKLELMFNPKRFNFKPYRVNPSLYWSFHDNLYELRRFSRSAVNYVKIRAYDKVYDKLKKKHVNKNAHASAKP
jgi:anaerobic magnesium-protoporphyrin IX monomethyl ester cyclase